jgi:endonuclease-3 related protein
MSPKEELRRYHEKLKTYFGPMEEWWPGDTPFEVMLTAVLVQHTNWKNVEQAIRNLKVFKLLSPQKLHELDEETLQEAIKPAGHFRQKASRLKALVAWLVNHYEGDMNRAREAPPARVRSELLDISGIGPETADVILLYALGHPSFVVDSYTYRVLSRHHLVSEETSYEEMQQLFHENLETDPRLFREYHAQLVEVGKKFCKTQPRCEECPLKVYLPQYR